MKNTYYIPQASGRTVLGEFTNCTKCKRNILVESILAGSNHTLGIYVTCSDCIDLASIKEHNPDLLPQFEEWLKK